MSGGTLQAGKENIGYIGTGTFVQTGGVNSAGSLIIAIGTGSYTLSAGTLNVTGEIEVGTSADVPRVPNALNLLGGVATAGSVTTYGSVLISSASGANTHGNLTVTGNYTQTGGTTQVDGSLTIAAGSALDLSGGTLFGSGSITGDVLNSGGTLSPGDGAGQLNLLGDYTQTSRAAMTINLGGEPATGDFGVLAITGSATVDGTLNVLSINGFVPMIGDTYTLLTASSVTGTFADVNSPYQLQVNYLPTGISFAVLPEPSAIGILVMATILLGRRRRNSDRDNSAVLSYLTTTKCRTSRRGLCFGSLSQTKCGT